MNDNELGTTAAREAEALEDFDGDFEANPLTGDNVLNVNATVGLDGNVREIAVSYNSDAARITVDLYAGTLTASAGGDNHTTHVGDSVAVDHATGTWEAHFDGTEVDV